MRKQVLVVFVILALVAVAGLSMVFYSRGVNVVVKNATGGEITNVQLKFRGGSKSSPKLKVDETFETRVNPKGETDLVVEFVDSAGKQHSSKVDVYIEGSYRGNIEVTLQPGGKITSKDEVKPSFF